MSTYAYTIRGQTHLKKNKPALLDVCLLDIVYDLVFTMISNT